MSFGVHRPEIEGVRVLEVLCEHCNEPVEYATLDDVGECPECGTTWRLHV